MNPRCNVCTLLETDRGLRLEEGIAVTKHRVRLTAILQSPPIQGHYLTVCLHCHPYYMRKDVMAVYHRFYPAAQARTDLGQADSA